VTERVVDLLEPVEIREEERGEPARARSQLEVLLGQGLERASVVQTGQVVEQRQPLELELHGLDVGHVPAHGDAATHDAPRIPQWGRVDRLPAPLGVIRRPHEELGAAERLSAHRARERATLGRTGCRLVGQIPSPVSEGTLGLVGHDHAPLEIRGDDSVFHAVEHGLQEGTRGAQPRLELVALERDLDHQGQLSFAERLEQVAERLRCHRPRPWRRLGLLGEKDNRDLHPLAQDLRDLDAVHLAGQANIHQHERRSSRLRHAQRRVTGDNRLEDPVSQLSEGAADVFCNGHVVFDYKNRLQNRHPALR